MGALLIAVFLAFPALEGCEGAGMSTDGAGSGSAGQDGAAGNTSDSSGAGTTGVAGAAGGMPATGAGGVPGGAGTSGTSGTTGAAGASAPPSCLKALFAACPTDTACVYAPADGGSGGRECYSNGVTVESTGFLCSTTNSGGEGTDVMKPDGSLCYTLRRTGNPSTACEFIDYIWGDGHTTVATGTLRGNAGLTITCAVGGESASYGPFSSAASGWFTTTCTAGACP